ncbi:leucine-rich repeat protein [Metamycoplasma hominis]|uniref:leucine-rich repeat protein n=1 Tax=Metamycoplasma hominis TaxID=2098 RepID=UPI001589094B|nr:leucine-rich repeat protein [Metamycoplasma hominis]QKX38297.1 leucine-rich repeat protein [Metamycoplasma hominis]
MKKSKKILLTMGGILPLVISAPLVAAGCKEPNKPEVKPEDPKKPEGEKPGTTPEVKPEDPKKPEGEKPGTTPEVKPEDKPEPKPENPTKEEDLLNFRKNFKFELTKSNTWKITKYIGNDSRVTIPREYQGKNITEIGERAFYGRIYLWEVILNEGLEKIGAEAFWDAGIKSITIPGSVKEIDGWAFDFSKISHISINLNNKNFEIKDNFFIDKNNKKILAYLDKKVTKVTIPDSVKEIGKGAFSNCKNLNEVSLNEGLEKIGDEAFSSTKIESITIPGSIKEIGEGALSFWDIRSISINSNNKNFEIEDNFFIDKNNKKILAYLDKEATKVTIPDSVKEICKGAFYGCKNLKEVILNEGLEKIGAEAFKYTNIESITIPGTVKEIGVEAFRHTNIKSITIPNSVKEIGERAFFGCQNLNEVILNEGLEKIGAKAFYHTSIESITIPGSVKEIDESTLSGCENLGEVVLNEGLERIGDYAFRYAKILFITIPGSVKEIGAGAFSGCWYLKEAIYKGDASNINWENTGIDKTKIKIISSNN